MDQEGQGNSRGPSHEHIGRPGHWQVAKHRAALGKHLHATHIRFHDHSQGVGIDWESRQHRKKHYPRHFDLQHGPSHHLPHPDKPFFPRLFGVELSNLSWWVAFLYTAGSCVWVVNGWFSMFEPASKNTNTYVVGYSGLVGGTLFELGGIAALLEALNAEPEVRVVPTPEGTVTLPEQPGGDDQQQQAAKPEKNYNHQPRQVSGKVDYSMTADSAQHDIPSSPPNTLNTQTTVLYPSTKQLDSQTPVDSSPNGSDQSLNGQYVGREDAVRHSYYNGGDQSQQMPVYSLPQQYRQPQVMPFQIVLHPQQPQQQTVGMNLHHQHMHANQSGGKLSQFKKWRWWGFKWRDMGWLGSFVQLIAATVFWIATITGVPGALPEEDETSYGLWDGVYWAPQVVGGIGFIISSALFMLETQRHWWQPRPLNLGWHVGFWNLIGGVGFFLSGLFGLYAVPADKYQYWGTYFSTFWGSWSFLLGSYIQLVEALNKHH